MIQQAKNVIRKLRDSFGLLNAKATSLDVSGLFVQPPSFDLSKIFSNKDFDQKWGEISGEISNLYLPENTGGVNIGDQRALVSLLFHFKPLNVLEIGTHIGCSTAHIAVAIRELMKVDGLSRSIESVDLLNVNDPVNKPWLDYSSIDSPINNTKKLKADSFTKFTTCPSVDFLNRSKNSYDFIFLDGSHTAKIVYNELPLATKLLKKNGVILLHDYFPGNKPLWEDQVVIPGPYLACEKLKKYGNKFSVVPLGELPWYTKRNSKITSLALVTAMS